MEVVNIPKDRGLSFMSTVPAESVEIPLGGTIEPGEIRLRFQLRPPPDCLGKYSGRFGSISHGLSVRASTPHSINIRTQGNVEIP